MDTNKTWNTTSLGKLNVFSLYVTPEASMDLCELGIQSDKTLTMSR